MILFLFLFFALSFWNSSPNLVFLSQSLLSGDASMRVRLAHEISHAWFGLLIGTKDWSEEWLSEGFATFIEEKIQSRAEKVCVLLLYAECGLQLVSF